MLRSALSAPKLMHTLRTSPCSDNPILTSFDALLRDGLCRIANVDISDLQFNGSRLLTLLKMGVLAYVVSPRWHLPPFWLQPLVPMNSSPLSCYGQTRRSLQLKGTQISQSTRPFQFVRQDMTQSNQTALRPGSSERGTWQASGPAIYSGWSQRIHTPEPGFWPVHQPLTAKIGCRRFQSLHAACVDLDDEDCGRSEIEM